VRASRGAGSQRLYGFRDILMLKVVKRLLDSGIELNQIRVAVEHLRERGTDLAEVTLMSDGVSVYECTSPDEVVDLLQGGQGVFGIAVNGSGGRWRARSLTCHSSMLTSRRLSGPLTSPLGSCTKMLASPNEPVCRVAVPIASTVRRSA
jgi:DNA-binding transcriptional MerR regulator